MKRLELRYLDWRIPVFIKFITKITKLQNIPQDISQDMQYLLWEMMEVMMLMHGSMLPATTNPPPLPPFRHILGISFEAALANEQPREDARLRDGT